SQIGLWIWSGVALAALLATVYTVYLYARSGGWSSEENLAVGTLLVITGVGFIISRFFMYQYLLVSQPDMPNWFSVPLGGVYVAFVGAVLIKWSGWRPEILGERTGTSTSEPTGETAGEADQQG
ncbi:MAG: hypothetical protein SXQ77_00870, partial [Halobacteria archaeon]|nr:hypothetical protein [Halobacteria archaeon]